MESLWIENRRNAISIETDLVFSTKPCVFLCSAFSGKADGIYESSPSPPLQGGRPPAYSQSLPGQSNRQLSRTGLPWAVEIVIAFSRDSLLKGTFMAQRESAIFTVTPGSLSGLAVIFLLLAALFALLNGQKMKALRANA